ncbi:hypothetical protein IEQ34_013644 [Dendrobium chrysotoxum]|uniref:Uncharacterized protein n=1 Tax=Dendrobium chrysotoxum TaxID=161865 RepID=A0AAV7GS58_DENCH|nr:hypothetical protein IEQ34_013644 [Dendrobium chrysotoxum]
MALEHQLSSYIIAMSISDEFSSLTSVIDLAKQIIKIKKGIAYYLDIMMRTSPHGNSLPIVQNLKQKSEFGNLNPSLS